MTTVPPKLGHARLKKTHAGLEIQLPMKGRIFIIAFLSFWLCGWLFGEVTVLANFAGPASDPDFPREMMLLWLVGWTFGGIAAISILIMAITLKEVIIIEPGKLQLKRSIPFRKPEIYDLQRGRNFCVLRSESGMLPFATFSALTLFKVNKGSIHFEQDQQLVRFAWGLDEMEARFLLSLLLENKLIAKEQLLPGSFF